MKLDSVYVVVKEMAAARAFYAEIFARQPTLVDDRFSGFDLDGFLFGLFSASHFGEAVDTDRIVIGMPESMQVRPPRTHGSRVEIRFAPGRTPG